MKIMTHCIYVTEELQNEPKSLFSEVLVNIMFIKKTDNLKFTSFFQLDQIYLLHANVSDPNLTAFLIMSILKTIIQLRCLSLLYTELI